MNTGKPTTSAMKIVRGTRASAPSDRSNIRRLDDRKDGIVRRTGGADAA